MFSLKRIYEQKIDNFILTHCDIQKIDNYNILTHCDIEYKK